MFSKGVTILVAFLHLLTVVEFKQLFEDFNNSQLEMRAVFINCDHDGFEEFDDLESGRVPREELYRHGKLEGCRKKLALTIKLTSDSANSFGEEYIPIEHVYDTANKKRVRLLNPYVLRLQRDQPRQAYPLQLVDIVKIMKKDDIAATNNNELNRQNRDVNSIEDDKWIKRVKHHDEKKSEIDIKINELESSLELDHLQSTQGLQYPTDYKLRPEMHSNIKTSQYQKKAEQQIVYESNTPTPASNVRDNCADRGFDTWRRRKRNEHNIIIESNMDEDKMPIWMSKDTYSDTFRTTTLNYGNPKEDIPKSPILKNPSLRKPAEFSEPEVLKSEIKDNKLSKDDSIHNNDEKIERPNVIKTKSVRQRKSNKKPKKIDESGYLPPNYQDKPFTLYAIGEPVFWHAIDVQLFEKRSDSAGKTVWKDVTSGYASVSSQASQFQNGNVALQYRPLDWVARDEFTLTKSPLCLLVADNVNEASSDDANNEEADNNASKFIILPEQDILGADHIIKKHANYSDSTADRTTNEEKLKKVVIRMSKPWAGVSGDRSLALSTVGSQLFLTMPHRQTHRAEIDLEARADDNQLVRVGTSGRISIVVSDSTRRTKSTVSVQAANTGLAAARFRVVLKDCGPEITSLMKQRGSEPLNTETQLVAPHHTKRFKLELPVALPVEKIHCSVSLINDKGLAVAMRDVAIKNADRCFCVWYCECVCLSEDPKLLCREMADSLLLAAGLTKADRPRTVRNVVVRESGSGSCFSLKRVWSGFLSIIVGLILVGFIKGVIGLCYIRVAYLWIDEVVKLPRPLRRYQEPWLRGENVIVDREGWPVHPHTKERDVHLMEYETMLLLNTILFILLFCMCICKIIRKSLTHVHHFFPTKREENNSVPTYNTLQMTTREKRKRRATCAEQWMTPDAEDLSKELWMNSANLLQPALTDNFNRNEKLASSLESEDCDDTEYVITQMQKSRESLAKCQRKHCAISNEKTQWKHIDKKSTTK